MSAVSATGSTSSIYASLAAPIASSSPNTSLVNTATSLSMTAAVVGTLGGGGTLTSATSLLNQLVTASQQTQQSFQAASGTSTSNTPPSSSSNTNAGGDSTSGTDGSASSNTSSDSGNNVYDASGALQNLGSADANWAQLLKTDPSLTGDAVNYTMTQGIINTLA